MRIGIDCRFWNESGVGRYTRNLIRQLIVLDHKNQYVLFVRFKDYQNINNQISKIKNNKNWKVIDSDVRWHSLEEQIKFPQILYKENLDLVHFPYFSVPLFYKRSFVVTIHDLILHHFSTGEASTLPLPLYKFKHLGYKFVVLNSIKRARKIITVSEATKKEIIEHFKIDQDKIVATYEGAEISSKFKIPASPANRGEQNSKLNIKNFFLYVGNAYPHKNLNRLIEAFQNLNQDLLRIKLILVGREDFFYKKLKEKVQKLGLEKNIIFYGEADDEELICLYKNAKALISPSLMEGFGLPSLEAMSLGCLVLASDIISFHEICADSAIYFNPYDIDDIAQKMKNIIYLNNANHYSENIKKGLERAKIFSWEKMAKETLEIYESCSSASSE